VDSDRPGTERPLRAVPLLDFLKEESGEADWLVDGVVPGHGLLVLAGLPKTFKSLLVGQLSLCVASDELRFIGRGTRHGSVVMVEEEGGLKGLQDRFSRQGDVLGELPPRLHIIASQGVRIDSGLAQLEGACAGIAPVMIVLDPMQFLHTKNENLADEMAPLMRGLIGLATRLGCVVVLVHHEPKPVAERAGPLVARSRGSIVIPAAAEAALFVSRANLDLRVQGVLRGAEAVDLWLRLDPETLVLEPTARTGGTRRQASKISMDDLLAFVDENQRVTVDQVRMHFGVATNTARDRLMEAVVFGDLFCSSGPRNRQTFSRR
jgi:hypothetical protein